MKNKNKEKKKPIQVLELTRKKFNVAKTILNYSSDALLNKLMNENEDVKKFIDFDKPFSN
jgi:uncharacterized surface protein with fasciclin (FAS1) repeats